jgi:predicted dehydrogenase
MRAPALPVTEALAVQVRHIASVLLEGRVPIAPGEAGLAVVRVLEAASRSLAAGGVPVELSGLSAAAAPETGPG